MRDVFSAMRRSLTSAAMSSASSKRGARKMSRSVSRMGIDLCRKVSGAVRSSNVIAWAPRKRRGEPASRLPSWNPMGPPVRWVPADLEIECYRLFSRSLRHRTYRYIDAALGFGAELDLAVGQCKQRVILAEPDIGAGMPLGAALAGNDVAGEHALAAENLQPEPLAVGVAAVAG